MATVLITGANRGIGLEFCTQFSGRGDTVIAACRKPSPELKALGVRIEEGVDVSDQASARDLAQRLDGVSVDLLINNAGLLSNESLASLDLDGIRRQFEVNSLGPLVMTHALLDRLANPAKVGIITSRMGSVADNSSGGMYGYRMSKAAVNMAGMSLAQDLKDRGVAVAILHPGFVKTEMTGHNGNITPAESVEGLIARLDGLTLSNTGTFWHTNGEVLPW